MFLVSCPLLVVRGCSVVTKDSISFRPRGRPPKFPSPPTPLRPLLRHPEPITQATTFLFAGILSSFVDQNETYDILCTLRDSCDSFGSDRGGNSGMSCRPQHEQHRYSVLPREVQNNPDNRPVEADHSSLPLSNSRDWNNIRKNVLRKFEKGSPLTSAEGSIPDRFDLAVNTLNETETFPVSLPMRCQ
jgi:hypothetical protein